ncbi:MAG TPA: hypothetical protein VFJ60_09650 [Gaiella sp.]|nr:hypothetical protein [Gaiella sp.]
MPTKTDRGQPSDATFDPIRRVYSLSEIEEGVRILGRVLCEELWITSDRRS